ncbi:DNA repair protein RadC [Vibrio sp. ZSDE26]|uniref:DNA repair protein RadC n=1 Tax=Vibrio amylolyticus TaxID=2847292 RepID=A0A9X1XKE6_9VIBR|nr:DNA repair protein RadC [Vibrio amylolyticus]MCK6263775.1 DNA repair protein RadC [Vibrio amylolyticus]
MIALTLTCQNHTLFTDEEKKALELAADILRTKLFLNTLPALTSPDLAKAYCQASLVAREHEVFGALFLDSQHRVRFTEELFTGTIDAASVYPREVVKASLQRNSAAVIFFHNHPSGVAEPSQSDRKITRRLTDALALIDVRVLDHFVISHDSVVSFAERGWI